MAKSKTNNANSPKTGSGVKMGSVFSVPAKAGTFNQASANTAGGKKKK